MGSLEAAFRSGGAGVSLALGVLFLLSGKLIGVIGGVVMIVLALVIVFSNRVAR